MCSLQRCVRCQTDRADHNVCESHEIYTDRKAARLLNSLEFDC